MAEPRASVPPGRGKDQAAGLRRMLDTGRLRVLPVDAGARGVGKTTALMGLAGAAVQSGRRVVLLDQSPGDLAGALSLRWRWELADLLAGERQWHEVSLRGPEGASLLPAVKGIAVLLAAGAGGAGLFGALGRLSQPPQLVLLNLDARGDGSACRLLPEDAELLLVTRSIGTDVTATYARMKAHVRRHGRRRFRLLVNRAREDEARTLHRTMADAAHRFMGVELAYAGSVPAGALPGAQAWVALAQALAEWSLADYGPGAE